MNKRHRRGGFTLIEMLVSMAIMTAVVSLASYSYRFYLGLSTKTAVAYETKLQQMQLWQRVTERVSETVDYYISPIYRPSERNFPLFIGNSKFVYSITSRGLFDNDYQALYWLGRLDDKLVYCERKVNGFLPTEDAVDESICDEYITLDKNVSELSFRYFGWRTLSDFVSTSYSENMLDVSQALTWFVSYQGRDRYLIPEWIELSYKSGDENKTEKVIRKIPLLNHDPDRISFYLNGSVNEGQ